MLLEGTMDQAMDQAIDTIARLNRLNNAIVNLPDDIIVHIYTKILKKYRLHEGKFIKLIDFEKYKFLENFVYRKMVSVLPNRVRFGGGDEYRIRYRLANFSRLPNRKSMLAEGAWPSVEDDLMDVDMTVNENTVTYDVHRYRLKKIEDLNTNYKPSIYHRGDYTEYDWEVIHYTYEI
jgi:hypothetical protein